MPTCNNTLALTAALFIILSFSACSTEAPHLVKEKTVLESYVDSKTEMKLHKVSERVYYVRGISGIATDNEGFISNSGFVVIIRPHSVASVLSVKSFALNILSLASSTADLFSFSSGTSIGSIS